MEKIDVSASNKIVLYTNLQKSMWYYNVLQKNQA
ncbi:MAG: hypothetical protein XD54_0188 [Thermococcus sibiricus]|uniref:Uncharacterized protein n=1 Tax=Thermococcus sibiricus TaxID=172049 RepID=A0A117L1Z1_9EURY|nr:MAG: hypothetical protein XD54_0188 [Thermococcus sibiricus]KUK28771.1 MAG: hypothetical protein XD61_0703 [Thermococcus sp. 40_45]